MVSAKGKASASKGSGSDDVASEAALTKDSSEMDVETGGFVETAVTEQTMITVVAKDETLEEENDGSEAEALEEENNGLEPETLYGEPAMNEDRDYKENEVVGGEETYTADKKAEDAVGNDEATNEETAIELEGGKQNIDDKQVGGAIGINEDNQEDGMERNEDETNAKNKEEVEGSMKPKTKRLRKRNNRKRRANQEKGEDKQVKKKVASISNVGEDSGKLESTEQSSKTVASKDKSWVAPEEIDSEGKGKPEPSRKKSSAKKEANDMGMIFMCNSETKKDCYRYKVLGMPANKKEMVEKIYKGMRLFLYDIDLKLMYGIYKAAGRGGCNIQPKAFKSQFPSQVRFTVLEECLPLAEETFRQAIKKNYYTRGKFDWQLSSEQVKDLCKLFSIAGKQSRSKDARLRPETNVVPPKRDRAKGRGLGERRRPDCAQQSERVEDRRYREHAHLHGRSLITSALVPVAPLEPLSPPTLFRSYAYSRTLGRDPYGRDTVIRHNDSYRHSLLVELPDAYRRDTVIGNSDVYLREALVEPRDHYRREGIPAHREYHHPMNLETRLQVAGGIGEPHVPYREHPSYHVPVNLVRSQPEYNPPPAGLRSEYLHGGTSARSILPEHPLSADGPLYGYPRQPQYLC